MARAPLSKFATSIAWLAQFAASDRGAAAALLDALLLLNEEQVSAAIRSQILDLCRDRKGKHRRMALYAEREFQSAIFESELTPDRKGRMRMRAVGRKGPDPVKPTRGKSRVGSEGLIAFVISQAKDTSPEIIMNHPGPDLLRGKLQPAGSIVVVTDFIGSGTRAREMLDAFWKVPSVRAWFSHRYVDFKVVAAAGTENGISSLKRHKTRPDVRVQYIVPTLRSFHDWRQSSQWFKLIDGYGPDAGRGAGRYGFGDAAALVAFSYRLPNNTPALLHQATGGWRALYEGAVPDDLRPAFGVRTAAEIVSAAAETTGVAIDAGLSPRDAEMVLILSLIRGRWRWGAENALAERTGMSVPDIFRVLARAVREGLITRQGRLTDAGQAILIAGRKKERRRPDIPTNPEPYYPLQLRTSRGPSSTRRPSGRP